MAMPNMVRQQITDRKFAFGPNICHGFSFSGKQSKLNLCFEHKFTKHAFSLCKGNFGGYKSREFFCITHLDGTLTFFEQDGIMYGCTLNPDRNIPSNLAYNPRTDSFVMVSPDGDLECYRFEHEGCFSSSNIVKNLDLVLVGISAFRHFGIMPQLKRLWFHRKKIVETHFKKKCSAVTDPKIPFQFLQIKLFKGLESRHAWICEWELKRVLMKLPFSIIVAYHCIFIYIIDLFEYETESDIFFIQIILNHCNKK